MASEATSTALERGKKALEQGAWNEARRYLDEATSAEGSAEAYEHLSWAAWWQCDENLVFSARERSYRLYADEGDTAGAARIATWLSVDYVDFRGEVSIATAWRQRAERLLADLPAAPEHAWLALLGGDFQLLVEENAAGARAQARRARSLAQELKIPDVHLLSFGLEGLAAVSLGDVAEGMKLLDEAAVSGLAGDFRERFSLSWTFCYLLYACERVRDYDRAAEWCLRMREYAERAGILFAHGVCRAHYAGILMRRGDWQGAESELAKASELLAKARPAATAEALVRLAELRRRQGRLDEASDLFRRAEPHPLALLGQAEVAIQLRRLDDAEEFVARLLRHIPDDNKLQQVDCLELQVRIQALAGNPETAAETWGRLASISNVVPAETFRAAASFCAGFVAAASGQHDDARRRFEDAVDSYQRAGMPYEAARARVELARVLMLTGRTEKARLEARSARNAFDALGAIFDADIAAVVCEGGDTPAFEPEGSLTPRQVQILRLIAEGLSDREIAARLVLSEHTVHAHVSNILVRLNLPSRAAAVAFAGRTGLLERGG